MPAKRTSKKEVDMQHVHRRWHHLGIAFACVWPPLFAACGLAQDGSDAGDDALDAPYETVAPSNTTSPPPARPTFDGWRGREAGPGEAGAGEGGGGSAPPPQAAGYSLAFADEFNTFDLSPDGTGNHTWYNGIWWESVAPFANIAASNSTVHLAWTRGQDPGDTSITTDARDGSNAKAWRYGYFEARMRWDVTVGAWPAIWLLPVQDRSASETGEIDIFEGQGGTPHTYYGTLHDWMNNQDIWSTDGKNAYQVPDTVDFGQYHTYGLRWTPGNVAWYFDNQPILSSATSPVFDTQDYYLILGAQEGYNWSEGDLTGVSANTIGMDVDWVRVWQK
jgi:hypothetical protein